MQTIILSNGREIDLSSFDIKNDSLCDIWMHVMAYYNHDDDNEGKLRLNKDQQHELYSKIMNIKLEEMIDG